MSHSNLSFPSQNPAQEIQKVAQFLSIDLTPSVLDQIVQHTGFDSMKENPMANYSNIPSSVLDQTVSPFMRKGGENNEVLATPDGKGSIWDCVEQWEK